MVPVRLPSEIAQALLRGATVLTANARAARWLGQAYAGDARASGQRSWQRPAILDWSTWTGQLYACLAREDLNLPLVLTGLQEELLWKRVQARDAAAVVSPERLAQLACSAYALLSAYNAHGSRRTGGAAGLWTDAHEDADRFLGWAEAFDRVCAQLDVISCSRIEGELQRHTAALPHHAELLLVGFDRLTPAQLAFTQTLEAGGCRVSQPAVADSAAEQQPVCSINELDEQTELQTCALWVRAQLEAASTEGTARRIGVLLPELAGARAAVDRAFGRVLLPQSARMAADAPSPYEFSLGVPLATVPLVHAALLLLRWLARPLPAAELTGLLLGGFLAVNAAEHLALAQSDAALRRSGLLTTEIRLGTLLRHVRRHSALLPQAFTRRLMSAERWTVREARGRRSFAVWAEAVPTLLEGLGWPGFQPLGSTHYQARAAWERLLSDAALLGFAGDAVTWAEFVRELGSFAHGRLFAAGSQDAPVQVMGITEAAGQNFDAVWLLQMTEDRWPRGGRMHPLLPAALQRDAAMPHTTAEGDLALAELQMRRAVASAPLVVASYARQSGGVDTRPSPLLSVLTGSDPTSLAASEASANLPAPVCETVREPDTATVAPWPLERIAGGSEILKRQAACGFQSFAAKRLRAVALDDEAWGLDAGERATLLHRALEQLWSDTPVAPGEEDETRLHTHDDLRRAIGSGAIDAMLEAAIVRSFTGTMREAEGDTWRTEYLQLEQRRLFTRLRRWLDVEADRAAFRVVAVERKLEGVAVGPLRLNLRLDRADEVGEAGDEPRLLLLDYKTAGTVHTKLWSGARPDEPQLPIYALFGAPFGGLAHVAGIGFAQIRAGDGKTRLHALAENPEALLGNEGRKEGTPDKRLLTPETRREWAEALPALAEAFAHGEAPVNPKHGAETCRLCGLYGLCRVRSQAGGVTVLPMEDDSDA